MSLVIAFTGNSGAAMAGDRREILFRGGGAGSDILEEELYTGKITGDDQLASRAKELAIDLVIRDDKCKVAKEQGILIGEVTETEGRTVRRRRLYVSAGNYAVVDYEGVGSTLRSSGEGSTFVVLGNQVTKQIANRIIRDHWKGGGLHDAIRIMVISMETASKTTASVSRSFNIVQTAERADLAAEIRREAALQG